jgi:hypothetical protein
LTEMIYGGRGSVTSRMGTEHVAYCLRICVYALDPRDEVTAVAFEKEAVFSPVIVLVVLVPLTLEIFVLLAFGIENEASIC